MDLNSLIREVPDFPHPGIAFKDITPLLQNPVAYQQALDAITDYVSSREADAVIAIESRGFLFGAPVANRLSLPLVPVRKPGRLPAAHMRVEYSLEYGEGELEIHADALQPGQNAVIVDDILATGGTLAATSKLVDLLQARVSGIAVLLELNALSGREKLTGYDVYSVLSS